MRRFLCGAVSLFAAQAMAGAPSWHETAQEDLHGPRVELSAEILEQIRDGDYTCFVLDPYAWPTHAPVVACSPGYFTQKEFAPGRALKVSGNMGAAIPRRIGAQVYDYPVIAGAIVKPTREPSPYPYYYDPYYDPFWPPYHRGYWW
jgi:hypothetical protein